jgi:hypothetical protein
MMGSSSSMLGANVALVSLENNTITSNRNTASGVGQATSRWILQLNGEATEATNINDLSDVIGTPADYNATDWWTGKPSAGIGTSYECRWSLFSSTSGNLDSFNTPVAENTWIDISSNRAWTLDDSCNFCEPNPQATRVITVDIRDVATQTIQATGTITFQTFLFGP